MEFTLKIFKVGKLMKKVRTNSDRRFFYITRSINWDVKDISAYIEFNYGKKLSNQDKIEEFFNDGKYENKADFDLAYEAFREEETEWRKPR